MTADYTLAVDDHSYQSIPESWLAHPAATDQDGTCLRCLAVSVAVRDGCWLRVRSAHPVSGNVVEALADAAMKDGDPVPAGLADGTDWPRSIVPAPGADVDMLRDVERDTCASCGPIGSTRSGSTTNARS